MAEKEREWAHLRGFADAIGDSKLLAAVPAEAPDFIMAGPPTIGVEITEFDGDDPSDLGGARHQASLRNRTIDLAERCYYELAPEAPLHVDVEFRDWPALRKERVRPLAHQLASFLAADHRPWPSFDNPPLMGGVAIPSIEEVLTVHAIRVPTRAHGAWSSGAGGWVRHATQADVQRAVAPKEKKLNRYRGSCDQVWLLVVFDLYVAGDHMAGPVEPISFSVQSGFDRIFCFDRIAHRALDVPIVAPRA